MFRRIGFRSEEMALALFLWLCSLPLVALIVIPLFGRLIAVIVALALFFVAMAICWGICGWKVLKVESNIDSFLERSRNHGVPQSRCTGHADRGPDQLQS